MKSWKKSKTADKIIVTRDGKMDEIVLKTMKTISDIVGATLGPKGRPVCLERQEIGLPALITKDGVTVFKHLGFSDPVQHAIMEVARDASVKTAIDAGDGTTTATVLSEAIVRYTMELCKQDPTISPQRVVRVLEKAFNKVIVKKLKKYAKKADLKLQRSVAFCSTNGDTAMTDAIMECYKLCGDSGNITLSERSGPSGYEVSKLDGYPVGMGYEDSCLRFYDRFLNDRVNSRVYLEDVRFVLNYGAIENMDQILELMGKLAERSAECRNYVLVATGFSESVLGNLAGNWNHPESSIKVYPLKCPMGPTQNYQLDFLYDLEAITRSKVYNGVEARIQNGTPDDIGPSLKAFEATRYRSNIIGRADDEYAMIRVDELVAQSKVAGSELETILINERIGKITGGIAKLTIIGPSIAEIREKKDRAEDAACAVRGAIKSGCLPGGCKTLDRLAYVLQDAKFPEDDQLIVNKVLVPALGAPLLKILENAGCNDTDIDFVLEGYDKYYGTNMVYDAMNDAFVSYKKAGIVDSVPAVMEAIRNSISVAGLLGTLGGIVVYPRDQALERGEAMSNEEAAKISGMRE